MRKEFNWLAHDEKGSPICNYCRRPLDYFVVKDRDKTVIYEICNCIEKGEV